MKDHPSPTHASETLARELRGFIGTLRRRLRNHVDSGDLPPSQIAVLHRLEELGPSTTSGLARAEGMRPQSMGTIVAALEAAGLVAGAPDPADGRQTLLSLTDDCRAWIDQGRAARQDWLSRTIEARLSPEDQHQAIAAMTLLRRLIQD